MFITPPNRGYTGTDQKASGLFLMVFSHNPFKWEDQNNTAHNEVKGQSFPVAGGDGFTVQRECQCEAGSAWSLKQCPAHHAEYQYFGDKPLIHTATDGSSVAVVGATNQRRMLYAAVRPVTLKQLGHFMMGTVRIAGQSVTVSGTYGDDGLPMDYEDLTVAARRKLVPLPGPLMEQFWAGGGHNDAGSEGPAMREWAIATFLKGKF